MRSNIPLTPSHHPRWHPPHPRWVLTPHTRQPSYIKVVLISLWLWSPRPWVSALLASLSIWHSAVPRTPPWVPSSSCLESGTWLGTTIACSTATGICLAWLLLMASRQKYSGRNHMEGKWRKGERKSSRPLPTHLYWDMCAYPYSHFSSSFSR